MPGVERILASGMDGFAAAILPALGVTIAVLSVHFALTRGRLRGGHAPRWRPLSRAIYGAAVLSVLVLAVTAFAGVLGSGRVAGLPLLLHTATGGVLLVLLALVALGWSAGNRFGRGTTSSPLVLRVAYWTILTCGGVSGLSALSCTLPFLGSEAMSQVLVLHAWAGLCLVLASLVHLYLVLIGRRL